MNTTLEQIKERGTSSLTNLPAVSVGFGSLQGFELMQRGAKLLSSSDLVPTQYRGNIANCVIALNMATRMGADPLMVMQNLYMVHGNPGWSAQFLIASFNSNGRFSPMRYEFFGERGTDGWGCRAWSTDLVADERITGADVTILLAKAEGWYSRPGSKWRTMPQQMLMYRAASWLVRTYAPELAMGLATKEELHDVYDAERGADGVYGLQERVAAATEVAATVSKAEVVEDVAETRDAPPATVEWPTELTDQETGDKTWVDSTGEFYDHNVHGWSAKENRPSVTPAGAFRARRGTARREQVPEPAVETSADVEQDPFGAPDVAEDDDVTTVVVE